MKKYTNNESFAIETAISFMVKYYSQYCINPKPVMLHSIKVALILYYLKVPVEYVIASILHDLIEDTKCNIKEVNKQFGTKVSNIVSALTQNYDFDDYRARWQDAEMRINKIGKYGWLIKMIDARDNLPYYSKILKSKKRVYEMMWKHNLVIQNARKYWSRLETFKDYNELVNKINKKWKIKF